jgi:hypothetical protein
MAQDLCPTGVLSITGEPSQSQVAQLYMSITSELFSATVLALWLSFAITLAVFFRALPIFHCLQTSTL